MTLRHYKEKILHGIKTETNNPQNWRMYKWLGNPDVKLGPLLKSMVRDGIIEIHFEEDRGKVKRIITQINKMH